MLPCREQNPPHAAVGVSRQLSSAKHHVQSRERYAYVRTQRTRACEGAVNMYVYGVTVPRSIFSPKIL